MSPSGSAEHSHIHDPRHVSIEFRKCYERWQRDGLMEKYLSGQHILDIGFRGGDPDAVPVTANAIGIELGYPGYDGTHLPFDDETQDAVFASAVLEHIPNYREVLLEWYRVLKPGGYVIVFVPHRYLYERRPDLPSRWNGDHRRFYTPASLLAEFDEAWPRNGFRVRHLLDDDEGFRYDQMPTLAPRGGYQIEMVLEKILQPAYSHKLQYEHHLQSAISLFDNIIIQFIVRRVKNPDAPNLFQTLIGSSRYFTPWHKLEAYFVYSSPPELPDGRLTREQLKLIIRPCLDLVQVDEAAYVQRYSQLKHVRSPALHWRNHGYFEGRLGSTFEFESSS
jgi:SAM-dependent methyltransferase